jgi:hypothetical protein
MIEPLVDGYSEFLERILINGGFTFSDINVTHHLNDADDCHVRVTAHNKNKALVAVASAEDCTVVDTGKPVANVVHLYLTGQLIGNCCASDVLLPPGGKWVMRGKKGEFSIALELIALNKYKTLDDAGAQEEAKSASKWLRYFLEHQQIAAQFRMDMIEYLNLVDWRSQELFEAEAKYYQKNAVKVLSAMVLSEMPKQIFSGGQLKTIDAMMTLIEPKKLMH